MTRRKSGLSSDDSKPAGLTSICNASESATEMRDKAMLIEKSIKRAQRYDTVTPTDLAAWPAEVPYDTLPSTLQKHVREYHLCKHFRTDSVASDATSTFDQLDDDTQDGLAAELCDIHTVILYTLHTQVLVEYVQYHSLGGEQTVHWESIPPGSEQQRRRQLVLDRMNRLQASSLVPGASGLLLDY
jgi:hypothetical protein